MILGILSDTHGHIEPMKKAVELLRQRGAEHFLHCGDVGSTRILDCLAGLPASFVFGNTDYHRVELEKYAALLGIKCCGEFGDLNRGGKAIALMHGDDYALKQRIIDEQRFDYLLLGHTHQTLDQRVGKLRIINPGALHRAARKTAALLDTEGDLLEFLAVA